MFMLKRIPDGLYVAEPGRDKSYTHAIKWARKFATREAAEADRCIENEQVVSLEEEINYHQSRM